MQALLVSLGAVAIAEIGDKTQLLSLLLAAKYRRPWPICAGVLLASLISHALATWLGAWLGDWLTPALQRWLIGGSFVIIAAWVLLPERGETLAATPRAEKYGVFAVSLLAFFLAELGDRTQIATLVLGAEYRPAWQVIAGSTLGMLVANAPVVWLGARLADRLPLRAARLVASALFAAIGAWILLR